MAPATLRISVASGLESGLSTRAWRKRTGRIAVAWIEVSLGALLVPRATQAPSASLPGTVFVET